MRKVVKETYKVESLTDEGVKEDKQFVFKQMHPKKAVKVSIRLAKLVGGPLGKVFTAIKKEKGVNLENSKVDLADVGAAIESLFDRIEENEVVETIENLLQAVTVDKQELDYNTAFFEGEPMLLLKVAKRSAEVNFSDFFQGLSGVTNRLKKLGDTILNQEMPTGGSGDQSSET